MERKILGLIAIMCMLLSVITCANAAEYTYGNLSYTKDDTGITITNCKENASGELVIPETIPDYSHGHYNEETGDYEFDELPVVKIDNGAFSACSELTNIVIPPTVKNIGDGAFFGCESLTNISIPSSVTSIGSDLFSRCIGIKHISIPDTVTDLSEYVFDGCEAESIEVGANLPSDWELSLSTLNGYSYPNLKKITLNSGTISNYYSYDDVKDIELVIGDNVSDLSNLKGMDEEHFKSIDISSSNPYFYSIGNAVYNKDKTKLIAYLNPWRAEHISLLSTIKYIDEYALSQCDKLKELYLPSGLKEIGEGNFSECPNLTKIFIPDSVETIADGCFGGREQLATVYVGKNVKEIGEGTFMVAASGNNWFGSVPCNNTVFYIYEGSEIENYLKRENNNNVTIDWFENDYGYRPQFHYTYIDRSLPSSAEITKTPTVTYNSQKGICTIDIKLTDVQHTGQMITILNESSGENIINLTPIITGDTEREILLSCNGIESVKTFIWDSLSGMRPLCDSVSIQKNEITVE